MELMATTRQEPIVAKKIYLHRNGLKGIQPKMIVVNERQVRDFSSFLNRVTSGIKAPVAVRTIYTPRSGSKIHKLEDLENGKHYVAGGNEHFKKMKYETITLQRRAQKQPPLDTASMKINVPIKTIHAASRFRNLPEKPYLIHVFRNGDALFKGVRVLLPRRLMNSWEHILELVTDKAELTLPAKRLSTLEGQVIHSVTDIKDGEKYVALEGARRFIKLPYSSIDPMPKQVHNRGIRARRLTSTFPSTDGASNAAAGQSTTIPLDTQPKIKRLMPIKQHKGVERPFAGHKNKAARNRALRYAQTDSAFGTDGQLVNTSILSESSATNDNVLDETHDLSSTVVEKDSVNAVVTKGSNDTAAVDVTPSEEIEKNTSANEGVLKQDATDDANDNISEPVVEELPGNETVEEPPAVMDINGGGTGVIELTGQSLNETVDLSVARKDHNDEAEAVPTTQNLPSQPNSKIPSNSNTPLNTSKASLAIKSKSSSKNTSRVPSNTSHRTTSKHSNHSNHSVEVCKTPTNGENNNDINNTEDNTKETDDH